MGQHYIWGSHPLYTTAHIAGSTKGKRRRRRRCSCRSLIRLSSVRHELSDKGRLCDSFYFFSLAVLLLLLLLRYIHSTHSIWNADESPSSIHRRRDCIYINIQSHPRPLAVCPLAVKSFTPSIRVPLFTKKTFYVRLCLVSPWSCFLTLPRNDMLYIYL